MSIHHCGNKVMEIRSGQFTPPAGWRFVVGDSRVIMRPATTTTSTTPTSAPATAPVPTAAPADAPVVAPVPAADTAVEAPAEEASPVASVTENGDLKKVAITITDEKGTVLSVSVEGHERALPTKLEKQNGRLVVFFHRDTTS